MLPESRLCSALLGSTPDTCGLACAATGEPGIEGSRPCVVRAGRRRGGRGLRGLRVDSAGTPLRWPRSSSASVVPRWNRSPVGRLRLRRLLVRGLGRRPRRRRRGRRGRVALGGGANWNAAGQRAGGRGGVRRRGDRLRVPDPADVRHARQGERGRPPGRRRVRRGRDGHGGADAASGEVLHGGSLSCWGQCVIRRPQRSRACRGCRCHPDRCPLPERFTGSDDHTRPRASRIIDGVGRGVRTGVGIGGSGSGRSRSPSASAGSTRGCCSTRRSGRCTRSG